MKLVHFPRRAAAAVLAAAVLAGAALPVFASDTSPLPEAPSFPAPPPTAPRAEACWRMAASMPLCRSQRRSSMVFLVPGSTTRSGRPSSRGEVT